MKYYLIYLLSISIAFATQYDCRVLNPDTSTDAENSYSVQNKTFEQCQEWFTENASSFRCTSTCIWGAADQTDHYQEIEQKKQIARDRLNGQKIVDHVIWLNDQRQASNETKLAFIGHAQVEQAQRLLNVGRIPLARAVIAGISVDGTILTQEMKQNILDFIDAL
jgi:hypothetical protein